MDASDIISQTRPATLQPQSADTSKLTAPSPIAVQTPGSSNSSANISEIDRLRAELQATIAHTLQADSETLAQFTELQAQLTQAEARASAAEQAARSLQAKLDTMRQSQQAHMLQTPADKRSSGSSNSHEDPALKAAAKELLAALRKSLNVGQSAVKTQSDEVSTVSALLQQSRHLLATSQVKKDQSGMGIDRQQRACALAWLSAVAAASSVALAAVVFHISASSLFF